MDSDKKTAIIDLKTVLLDFSCSELRSFVSIGFLRFTVKPYISQSIRCFECNRSGHIAANYRGKAKCPKCGGEHHASLCNATFLKYVNCGGIHSAANENYSLNKRETQVLKIQRSPKLSYAEACKELTISFTRFSLAGNNHEQSENWDY